MLKKLMKEVDFIALPDKCHHLYFQMDHMVDHLKEKVVVKNQGIGAHIISNSDNDYVADPNFKEWLQLEYLGQLSGKYHHIVSIETHQPGCGFIFTDLVSGSGAIVLGQAFEANPYMGPGPMYGLPFERFNEKSSIFINDKESKTICAGPDMSRYVKVSFEKKPRYALITGETPDSVMDAILEIAVAPENIDGEYIKEFIVSPVGDGINIYHVLRGHLATAGWHPSGMHQALSRFLRSTSHDELIKRLQAELIEKGEDPSEATIEVEIYKHAAVPSDQNIISIDVNFYQHAESKSIPIHRIMRILKQIDMGVEINRDRNIRQDDEDYSEQCDYDICDYKPLLNKEQTIDYSTYDILYAEGSIGNFIEDIKQVLLFRSSRRSCEGKDNGKGLNRG